MIWLAAIGAGICIFAYLNNTCIVCSRHEIHTQKAQGRILHLSDLHSCRFTERLKKRILREKPDLIVITGDLWDRKKRRIHRMVCYAEELCRICPVVYVPGNHEFHEPDHERIFAQMKQRGIDVLRHRIKAYGGITVLGMDLLKYGAFTQQELKRLEQAEGFRLAAAHYPESFERIFAGREIDLVLCGHAHGGQFRIPFLKKGLYSPGQGVFPRYSEGLHEKDGVKMIVSRGIGNSRFPFRLFNLPEIVVIDLKRK